MCVRVLKKRYENFVSKLHIDFKNLQKKSVIRFFKRIRYE